MPESSRHAYERLRVVLHQLMGCVDEGGRDLVQHVKPLALEGQQLFQHEILLADLDDPDLKGVAQLQSIKTEMNKELRLLNTDVLFLGSAQQRATTQRRIAQLRDRLTRLIQYCDLVLDTQKSQSE